MLMDMLDGKVARMTKTTSQFGVELDSLADVVSFGVAPAFVLYSMPWPTGARGVARRVSLRDLWRAPPRPLQRLRGVTDKRYFVGLPIPAAAGVVASVVLLLAPTTSRAGSGPRSRRTYLVAILMVTTFRYYSFKEIDFARRRPAGCWCSSSSGADRRHSSPVVPVLLFFAYALSARRVRCGRGVVTRPRGGSRRLTSRAAWEPGAERPDRAGPEI